MDVINAMFLSVVVGAIIALPAVYSEIFRRGKDLPILMDVHACWGKTCTSGEVFILSIFVHMVSSLAFGGGYVTLFFLGWFRNFSILSILSYAIIFYLFWGVLVLPLIRLGFFGRREGGLVWAELLTSHVLFGLGLWAAFKLFPVFLPF